MALRNTIHVFETLDPDIHRSIKEGMAVDRPGVTILRNGQMDRPRPPLGPRPPFRVRGPVIVNHLFGSFHGSRFHASERNWSIYGQIKPKDRTGVTLPSMPCYCPSHVTFATRARAQLRHDTADKLVFCHVSIHLRDKLQTARVTRRRSRSGTRTRSRTRSRTTTRTLLASLARLAREGLPEEWREGMGWEREGGRLLSLADLST